MSTKDICRKFWSKSIGSFLLVLTLVSVSVFISSADSSGKEQTKKLFAMEGDTSPGGGGGGGGGQSLGSTKDPVVTLDCTVPKVTVALMVDRSDSIIRANSGQTPDDFKKAIYRFLDGLYARFALTGKLDVLVYAFATKSVIQNEVDPNTNDLITDASTPTTLAAIKKVVERIYFRDGNLFNVNNPNAPGFQYPVGGTQYDRDRAYNAGSTSEIGDYGGTNWQDPLTAVMRQASDGRKIDLAVMLTDGMPNASDWWDWRWTANGPSLESQDLTRPINYFENFFYSAYAVNNLRHGSKGNENNPGGDNGLSYAGINDRAPISVRSIVIHSPNPHRTPAQQADDLDTATTFSEAIFGPASDGNYIIASNFTSQLELKIDEMIHNIEQNTNCGNNNPVNPKLTLSATPGSLTLQEGSSDDVRFTVKNDGDVYMTSMYLCIGNYTIDSATNKVNCDSTPKLLSNLAVTEVDDSVIQNFVLNLGQNAYSTKAIAFGEAQANSVQLNGLSKYVTSNPLVITITPERVALPA